MIIFNAILLGVEIDIAAKTSQNAMPVWFGIAARTADGSFLGGQRGGRENGGPLFPFWVGEKRRCFHNMSSLKRQKKLIALKNVHLDRFLKVNTCLVVIFATETLAKLFALGCGGFWRGDAA